MNTTQAKGIALITGASTGIGAIYADRLAKRGHDLILVARNKERLASLARRIANDTGRKVETVEADLTSPADLRRVEDILRTNAGISMLVNNAGVGATAPLVASDVDKMEDMIRLNVTALTRLTYAAVPGFVARGNGTIINISSVVAIAPERLNGVYGGTKAFVLALDAVARSRARRQGRPRAGGAARRHGHRVLGHRRHAGSPASGADRDVGRRSGRRRSGGSRPRRDRDHPVAAQPGGMGSLRSGAPRDVGQAFERHRGPPLQPASTRTAERLAQAI